MLSAPDHPIRRTTLRDQIYGADRGFETLPTAVQAVCEAEALLLELCQDCEELGGPAVRRVTKRLIEEERHAA